MLSLKARKHGTRQPAKCEAAIMSALPFREMTTRERALMRTLLEPEFPGRDELAQQLETAKVRLIDEDGGMELSVQCSTAAKHVKYRVPTEGEYEDPDGVTVHVLLHVVGDKPTELEFYRDDGSRVRAWPTPSSLRVFAPK